VVDVAELPTHGGSLRVLAMRDDSQSIQVQSTVAELVAQETMAGVKSKRFYSEFESKALQIRNDFIEFLIQQRGQGRTVVGYGAAAKGNTLLNFAGVRKDLMTVVADRNPAKIGKYLPGSRIPIVNESELEKLRPNFVVILPWNLKSEIGEQLQYVRKWGGRLVAAVPSLVVW